jgi:hypothetical protein
MLPQSLPVNNMPTPWKTNFFFIPFRTSHNSLVAVQVGAIFLDQTTNPTLKNFNIYLTFHSARN